MSFLTFTRIFDPCCVSSLGIACVGCVWLYSGCWKTSTSINSWHRFHRYKPKLGVGLPLSNAVSLRSEPSSRNALEHEQCYPSQLLHQEDALSRHRGRKPTLQYELSGGITLLSPAYLLSIKRHPFHEVMPDHYKHGLTAILLELSLVQSSFLSCYYTLNFKNDEVEETYIPPLLFGRFPPQANYQI